MSCYVRAVVSLLVFITLALFGCNSKNSNPSSPSTDTTSQGTDTPSSSGSADNADTSQIETHLPTAPMPPSPVTATSYCPPDQSSSIGTNTQISVRFSSNLDLNSVPGMPLTVACSGSQINGTVSVSPQRIDFIPSNNLPANNACIVSLVSGISDTAGHPVTANTWIFNTDTNEARYYTFTSPLALEDGLGYIAGILTQGSNVILFGPKKGSSGIFAQVSSDGGSTFHFSDPILSPSQYSYSDQVVGVLKNGTIHLAWHEQSNGHLIKYTHSTDSFDHFSDPIILDDGSDGNINYSPKIAFDGDKNIYIAWQKECSVIDGCGVSPEGIYAIESHNGGNMFVNYRMVTNVVDTLIGIDWYRDKPIVAWHHQQWPLQPSIQIVDLLFDSYNIRATNSDASWDYFGEPFIRTDSDEFLMQTSKYLYSPSTDTFSLLAPISNVVFQLNTYATQATGVPHKLAVLVEDDDYAKNYASRILRLSDDNGMTYYAPQEITLMNTKLSYTDISDWGSSLSFTSDGSHLLLFWHRDTSTTRALMSSQGEPAKPCSD